MLSGCGGSGGGSGGGGGAASTSVLAGSLTAPGLYGKLPAAGTPASGGTVTYGQLTGQTPDFIFPVIPSADASTVTFQWIGNMFLPLYNQFTYGSNPGVDYQLSLAGKPVFSNGNKTITVPLDHGYKWTDGKPVDATDLLFDIALIKAAVKENASNWTAYTPGYFPDSLQSITAPNPYTVVMHLNKAFNPAFFANNQLAAGITPLPASDWNIAATGGPHLNWQIPGNAKKIFDYLSKAGGQVGTFGTNPLWKIADGPFTLTSWSPVTSSWTLTRNPTYGGTPKPALAAVQGVTYTGVTPQLNAMLSGGLDIGTVDFSQLVNVSSLKSDGYSVFGYPDYGWAGPVWNFEDKTGHFNDIVRQLYFRQAMMMLQNENAIIEGIYHGAAGVAYGPVPSVPHTPFAPANSTVPPYPYDPAKAVALLKSHGWHVVPNGITTCQRAGSGPGQCGAGIPAGTPLTFSWATQTTASSPFTSLTDETITSEAKEAAGINVKLFQKTFNFISANYNDPDPSVAKYKNDWGVENYSGFNDAFYPTQNSIFNTGGSYNSGGFSDPKLDALIKDAVFGSNPDAVTNEASYEAITLPALWAPNYDEIWAVSKRVGGTPQSFMTLTQYGFYPQFLYLKKQ